MTQVSLVDRRSFVKGMLAAGATVTVAACAPIVTAPAPAAPVAPPVVTGPAWIHPKSLVRASPGYGGAHLTWKVGDAAKWLPPEKYPADAAADALAKLPKEKLTDMYYRMNLMRTWQNALKEIALGPAPNTMYRTPFGILGEEALAVGVCATLNKDDFITATHRGDHNFFAKGADPKKMSGQAFFRATGYSQGKSSLMTVSDPSVGIIGGNGIVGMGPPLAAGAAWNFKVKKSGQVVVSHQGDGSVQSRHFFVAVRGAANYKLPVVFVIENNFYGASSPIAALAPSPYMADYTTGLGIPTVVADGNNIAQVYETAKEAVARARAGEGPSVLEFLTYRWYDHSGWGGAKAGVDGAFGLPYRTDDEVRTWLARDPIVRYGAFLVGRGLFTQAELDAIKQSVSPVVKEAIEFAQASPEPRPEDGLKHVYREGVVPATQFFEHRVVT